VKHTAQEELVASIEKTIRTLQKMMDERGNDGSDEHYAALSYGQIAVMDDWAEETGKDSADFPW